MEQSLDPATAADEPGDEYGRETWHPADYELQWRHLEHVHTDLDRPDEGERQDEECDERTLADQTQKTRFCGHAHHLGRMDLQCVGLCPVRLGAFSFR